MTKQQLLEVYDRVVGVHPEYRRMIRKIARLVRGRVLEVGAGTGLLTEQLLKNRAITKLVVIEPDSLFIKKFKEKFPRVNILRKDGITFRSKQKFDCIVMSLVCHHIPDEKKAAFLRNLWRNLRKDGTLMIGDVFLLPYKTEKGRDRALKIFHTARIQRMKDKIAREVERQALRDGLKREGEYKTSYEVLNEKLDIAGFSRIASFVIGNQNTGSYKIVTAIR